MTLAQMLEQLDTLNECILYDVELECVVWKGDTFILRAAILGSEGENNQFIKECMEINDFYSIDSFNDAKCFADSDLIQNEDGESVLFFPYINDRGVPLLNIQFNIK